MSAANYGRQYVPGNRVDTALSSARVRMSFQDGPSREVDINESDIVWSEGGLHQVENLGPSDDWGIIVEFKTCLLPDQ
ncbi:MAG: hypothetical protein KGJ86_16745 [Chloroflexota bacterium]|nr:hypothetical protein [Chloroflexota bacterium]